MLVLQARNRRTRTLPAQMLQTHILRFEVHLPKRCHAFLRALHNLTDRICLSAATQVTLANPLYMRLLQPNRKLVVCSCKKNSTARSVQDHFDNPQILLGCVRLFDYRPNTFDCFESLQPVLRRRLHDCDVRYQFHLQYTYFPNHTYRTYRLREKQSQTYGSMD